MTILPVTCHISTCGKPAAWKADTVVSGNGETNAVCEYHRRVLDSAHGKWVPLHDHYVQVVDENGACIWKSRRIEGPLGDTVRALDGAGVGR